MSDTQNIPIPEDDLPDPDPSEHENTDARFDADEVDEGHADAILCYALNFVFFPYSLRALMQRDNAYTLYHAKQALVIWGGMFSVMLLGLLLLPLLGLGLLVWLAGIPPLAVLNFFGLLQALNDEAKPIPFLEEYPHQWIRLSKKSD